MTTDNDTNFGPVVTSPSSFGVVFQHDKDMPALHCVDLFPNPPRQLDDASQDILDNIASDNIADLNSISNENSVSSPIIADKLEDNLIINSKSDNEASNLLETLIDGGKSPVIENSIADLINDLTDENHQSPVVESRDKEELVSTAETPSVECVAIEAGKTPNRLQFPLPVVSPALSISSHYSSAESVSSATSTSKKKKKKRICVTCGVHFSHKAELLEHLKLHVGQPTILMENLSDDNVHLQDFRERQNSLTSGDEDQCESETTKASNPPPQHEPGGLKLKLKLSGSQNFKVVPITQLTEKTVTPAKKPVERILTAQEVKQNLSPVPSSGTTKGPLDAMIALTDMQPVKRLSADDSLLENRYFECPTLDGLDQYAEELNNEAAEDLLKKLLEGGQQMPQENDWASNSNEFISIDRLAYMCPICNANFPDAMRLYDHKRITGHDFQHPMHPPPPPSNMPHMDMMSQYRMRPPFQPQIPTSVSHTVNMHANFRPGDMRPHFQVYHPPQQRFVGAPPFNQAPQARRPPPLYRVPAPQSAHPVNMAPFAEMSPEMYIPSSNGNVMINGNFQPNQPHLDRQALFLKARLQRPPQRPRTPGMYDGSPNGTPSPPVVLSQQTITRPRFLGPTPMPTPMPGPPAKKIKQEPGADDCEIVSTQPRNEGLPVIQSVQGGATIPQPFNNDRSKDPILLNDQITLSLKNRDQNQNPKEVASILANRGITVTHKPKPPGSVPAREASPSNAQEAVQKLQLNNSVSIISKKRSFEMHDEPARPSSGDSAFLACPTAGCEEKFLTQEGLNRHTQRGHKMAGKIGLKAFKCKLCPAMFSTPEGLMEHQRKTHRMLKTSADEVGIPIVDLRNEETKRKLAQLGIVNYIPLNAKTSNGCFGFPIVSVQGAGNPNICNMQGMGVNSLLSLGPIKQIPLRKMD